MRGSKMSSFRANSSIRGILKVLLCVFLAATLCVASGCQLLSKDNLAALFSDAEKTESRDQTEDTEQDETEPEETEPEETEPDETEPEETEPGETGNGTDGKDKTGGDERAAYTMDLTLDTDAHSIGGSVTVDVFNYSDDEWDSLCFRDYPSLFTADNDYDLTVDGKISDISNIRDEDNDRDLKMERSTEDVSVVFIGMEDAIKPGETRRISFDFVSYVPLLEDRFGYTDDMYNLSNFYPVLAVYEEGDWVAHPYFVNGECFYSLVSDYFVTFHTPSDMMVACSGEETMAEEGTWSVEALSVRDISAVIGEDLKVVTDEVDGVKVNCYYTENKRWAEIAVKAGVTAIEAFDEAFGPYPYPEIDIIQTYLFAGGMEYPSIVLIYKGFEASKDPDATLSSVVAHEIAHQWFYSLVGDDQYDEAWLDESFASYAEYVYMETYLDEAEIEGRVDYVQDIMGGDDFENVGNTLRLNRAYDDFGDDDSYVYTAYYYGKVFLYRLREAMGDEDFTLMMKAYVKEFSNEVATTEDFVDYVHTYAGDNEDADELLSIFLPGVE